MSGLYPSEDGVFNNVTTETAIHPNPYPGTPFWGQWLKAAGYSMGYVGKLHVGRDITPESCGFENVCALEQDSLPINLARKAQQWKQARTASPEPSARRPGEILRPGSQFGERLRCTRTCPDSRHFAHFPEREADRIGVRLRLAGASLCHCIPISAS